MTSSLHRRVLVIGPSNIGDALLAGEVIARIRQQEPEAHLTLVVGERAQILFSGDPRIQSLVNIDAFSSALGRLKLAAALWRYHPHVIVDLRHTVYPLLLNPLSAWRFMRRPPAQVQHMRERHLWKLQAQVPRSARTGGQAPDGLWLSERDLAAVELLCRRWRLRADQPLVIICPAARSHIKRWPAQGFAQVADRLATELSAQVVFSGEADEAAIVDEIVGLMRGPAHTAVGLTTIRQLAALMRRAALVITNDSASLHAASAVGTATVAIFGPTDAVKYGPTALRRRVIRRRLFCSPCEQALCRFNHECMRFIAPDDVFSAARELLESHDAARPG